jgi:hypothetical protein
MTAAGFHRGAQAEDGELASDDDQRHPGGGAADRHQAHERRGHQQLVGRGVQERAELGGDVPGAGEPAVKPIGRGGDQEEDGRSGIGVVQQQRHDHRRDHDAHAGADREHAR